jgi:two-component sensor histidine kinase
VATPLAVVLNELVQNAIEHGLGDGLGTVSVRLSGGHDQPVVLEVQDNGAGGTREPHPPDAGAPEGSPGVQGAQPAVHSPGGPGGTPGGGLGLRLVRALVEEELNGQFTLSHLAGRGSIATATIPPVGREG